ncbi:hypothetical protein RhiirA1_481439 [Rhizophagus irregularis]|uniref:Uncharacterized protein n=1 Tax=Rhizophagus irregularis TaxID=588596 RepID=A0A2N0QN33_9GLOM|nr:hypothetical protein RhiirA1_481439 [Rhizophagus irregularis]GET56579.1 hypothetical protein RIR_e26885_A0A2N0QN33_9GLOM [Rhizophagus irregularis DAOM 181602=DAOM 197198]GET64333.1 hypothetical protein RIR_e26886_A0A2N0QN33_9GLOM [Rhizophagus irregularis DAOM 181602=DAOM 197198]
MNFLNSNSSSLRMNYLDFFVKQKVWDNLSVERIKKINEYFKKLNNVSSINK